MHPATILIVIDDGAVDHPPPYLKNKIYSSLGEEKC